MPCTGLGLRSLGLLLVRCWADYSADVSENYLPKTCKYPPLPDTLDSVAYLSETTDVHIGEVRAILRSASPLGSLLGDK